MAANRYEPPTEDEFVQEITARAANIPNCKMTHRTVLKAGPQTYKSASILQFTRPDTGDVSHRELQLDSYPFRVTTGLDFREEKRLAKWSCRDHEIERLRRFLENYQGASEPGTHKVVRGDMAAAFNQFLSVLGKKELRTSQLLGLIGALADRASDLRNLPELGEAGKLRMAAAAIRVAHRTNALVKLRKLIDEKSVEPDFQTLLEQNWWMLGSHYLQRIERRQWTNEETVDIMLRTADGYFEVIEIKRSIPTLFKRDHDHWIVTAEVNDAVNQAAHYIAEIERSRSTLFQRYKVDLYKLKAKILIGLIDENEEDVAAKREALRMYNSHLHRIEVVTYDHLVRIAENVITSNAGESGQEDEDAIQGPVSASDGEIPL